MKILHIGKYYSPYAGGMESVVKDLCEGQTENGHDVTVLCYNDGKNDEETTINGVKVIRKGCLGVVAGQPISLGLYSFIRMECQYYDIVHIHSPNPLVELLALTIPAHVPIVSTHHSDIVRQKKLLKYYLPIYRKFLSRVQKIFIPTQNHIDYSNCLPDFTNKCEIIPFGIRVSHLHKRDIAEDIEKVKKEYGPFALFVGRLVPYKGVDVLVSAAAQTDYKVVVVGAGPESENLKKQIKRLGLEDQVHMLGKVTDDKLFRALYHACEFLVLPSVTANENFGITQLEAMACHKAVITTKLKSGVPAVGMPGKTTLLTNPGSANELASCMTILMENESLCRMMGDAAFMRFQELYQWESMIKKTLESYERTIGLNQIIEKHRQSA